MPKPNSPHRSVVYCLLCQKAQDNLSIHLARVCMKDEPNERRRQEVKRAMASMRDWSQKARIWDHEEIIKWFPNPVFRDDFVAKLKNEGYFFINCPGAEGSGSTSTGLSAVVEPALQAPSGRVLTSHPTSLHECLRLVRVALPDMLAISRNLAQHLHVTEEQKSRLKSFCQAILILKYCLKPAVVEALSAKNWVERHAHDGRVIVGVDGSVPSAATFALSEDDAAMLDVYYVRVRAAYMQLESGQDKGRFFLGQSGSKLHSASSDVSRLHRYYQLPNVGSQDVRRLARAEVARLLPEEQAADLSVYLALAKDTTGCQPRRLSPDELVAAANKLSNLQEGSSQCFDEHHPRKKARVSGAGHEADFAAYLHRFPVTLDGKPPSKKERAEAGHPTGRSFYDSWRAEQLKLRKQFLLGKWTRNRPSMLKVQKFIVDSSWQQNSPSPADIVARWTPPKKDTVEKDTGVIRRVTEQSWKGLVVTESTRRGAGQGVLTTKMFAKGSIVCDYHGKVVKAAAGRRTQESLDCHQMGYMFFFHSGTERLCVDAQNDRCDCHPDLVTFGRRINHSSKLANLSPLHCVMQIRDQLQHVILFKATRDIKVNEELLYDYGVRQSSFQGEGLGLEWLDQ